MSRTRIHSEVDFDKEGKQSAFLRLPHSVHRSAYGWIPIPIVRIKNGTGPSVVMQAGTHGDEWEGQVGLGNLIRELKPRNIQGKLVILPSANFPAAMAGTRTSPIDEGNLNRSFPGDSDGRPTAMIAHYIENLLLPMADYVVDLHSGRRHVRKYGGDHRIQPRQRNRAGELWRRHQVRRVDDQLNRAREEADDASRWARFRTE